VTALSHLPPTFADTCAGLRALACYVIAPARKAVTERIGLRSTPGGFGTPPFGDRDRRVRVRAERLIVDEGGAELASAPITTLTDAAALVGIPLSSDPGVGHDIPAFAPDTPLAVDPGASLALGAWYEFAVSVIDGVRPALEAAGTVSEAQLWPEHFDLAADHQPATGRRVNLGFSPGDGFHPEPYVYLGPWDRTGLDDPFWNAPFGAYLSYDSLLAADDAQSAAREFLTAGLALL